MNPATTLFALSLAAAAGATPAAAAPPARDVAARVDAVFAAYDRPDSPGCALGVVHDGRLVRERGYGLAGLERYVPITVDTIFDIGSTSKQFAAAALALLEIDGRLSLDDDLRRHVPEIPAYERPITLRHLLHHTSGL